MKKRKVKVDVDFEGVFRGRKIGSVFNASNKYLHKLANVNRPKRSSKERPPEPKTKRSRAEVKEDREL